MTVKAIRTRTMTSIRRGAILLAVVGLFLPGISAAQRPDRSKPPELGPPAQLKLPPIQHFKLSNGLPVVVMEKHELPLVQVELLVQAGAAMDPRDKGGLASLTADMMEEGAGSRTALQLADAIDYLGASINAFASTHTSMVNLHTPLSKLDTALALFADVALRPTFPPEELERRRKDRLTTLLQWHDEPRAISSVAFYKLLYGDNHPYGRMSLGTEKSLRSFRVGDLKNFYGKYYHPDNAALIIAGDVTPAVIVQKLEGLFGSWKSGESPAQSWPSAEQVKQRKIFLVDKPAAAQSVIQIGRIGVQRATEDYFALTVLNTILGGSFTSRLNQNLREEHGYTYGAGSYFDLRVLPGPFVATASVQTDSTDKALSEFMKELTNIMQPVTDDELTRAKNYLALGYPGNFESLSAIASQLSELVVYQLPDDYFNTYTKNILAVTKDDLNRVTRKYLDPDNMYIVLVGDRQKIEQGVKALNLAPVEQMQIDEVLGKAPVVDGKKY